MNKEEFQKQLNNASKIVDSWPEWKKHLLENSLKSTYSYSRLPHNHPALIIDRALKQINWYKINE
jgi:hypothetical protein